MSRISRPCAGSPLPFPLAPGPVAELQFAAHPLSSATPQFSLPSRQFQIHCAFRSRAVSISCFFKSDCLNWIRWLVATSVYPVRVNV